MTHLTQLDMRGMRKRFGTVQALDAVDFSLTAGEIHGLLGENGAGKSTLMKVLFGEYRPDAGTITLDGGPYRPDSPLAAIRAGIGMVHQHFHLVETFTVTENVVLGERGPSNLSRLKEMANRLGLADVLDLRIERLSVGVRQRVEILKCLYRDARVLLLDEPTSVLTPQEVTELFQTLSGLRMHGVAIVLITHKLQEVLDICDRITVMRRGTVVASLAARDADREGLASLMVGEAVPPLPAKATAPGADIRLSVRDLTTGGGVPLRNLSFEVRRGEIFGIAGVDGNGQVEVAEALAGLIPTGGTLLLDGARPPDGRRQRAALGIGYVPQDRREEGLAMELSLAENSVLGWEASPEYRRNFLLSPAKLRAHVARLMDRFDIRAAGPDALAGSLSGGNQQKLLLARELEREPKLLVAVNPTWGVDIGAIEYIHRQLLALRERGGSVVLISNELDEIYALADRFAVLHAGRLSAPLAPDVSRDRVGLLMAGAVTEE